MLDFLLSYPFIIYTLLTTSISGAVVLTVIFILRIKNPVLLFRLYLIPPLSPFVLAVVLIFVSPPTAGKDYYIASPIEGLIHAVRLITYKHSVPVAYLACLIPFIYFIFRFVFSLFIDKKSLKEAKEIVANDKQWSYLFDTVANQARRRRIRCPRLYLIDSPLPTSFVFGFYRCGIILSKNLLRELDSDSLEALISHELTHIDRLDTAVMWLVLALKSLMFYDPTIQFFFRLLRRERERACDAETVNATHKPLALATALYRVYQLSHSLKSRRRLYYFNPSNAAFLRGSSSFNNRLIYLLDLYKSNKSTAEMERREKFGIFIVLLLLSLLFLKSWLPPAVPVKCSVWNQHHLNNY